MSTPTLGASDCCYTSFPPRDKSVTNLNACNTESSQQRSLCIVSANLNADTIRANTVIANEIIVEQLVRPLTTAGVFSSNATAAQAVGPGTFQYDAATFGVALSASPNNAGVSINASADQVIVDQDGWYQISMAVSGVSQGAASEAVWGITVNGTATFYPLDTIFASVADQTIRGSIGVRLLAGDLVGIAIQTTANGPTGESTLVSPSLLAVARVGA